MNKTTRLTIPWLFLLCLLCACAGTPEKETESQLITRDGVKALEKGNRVYAKGCYGQAAVHFSRAHREFTAADDLPGIAMSLNSLGNVYQANGEADNAVAFFDEALTISDALGDREAVLQALANKAAALIGADRLEEAASIIQAGEARAASPFLPLQIHKGILMIKQGAYPQAQAVLEKALADVPAQDRASQAKIHFALGRLMGDRTNTAAAIEHFQQALAGDRVAGFYAGMAQDHSHLGDAYSQQASPEKALAHYKQAIKLYALIGDRPNVKQVMAKLDRTATETGADIRLTTHFVKRWLEDKRLERPCQ